MTLPEYANALRRRWYWIIVFALVGAVLAFGSVRGQAPTYQATAKTFVSLSSGATAGDLVQGSAYIKNVIDSYAALTDLPIVLDPVINELGLNTSAHALAGSIDADSPLNTSLIEIKASSGDPQMAADLANAVARQLAKSVDTLSAASDDAPSVKVSVVSPATAPGYPIAPRKKFTVITGFGVGLVLGVVLALALAAFDTRIRTPRDLTRLNTEAPMLGVIPRHRRHARGLPVVDAPLGVDAEAYRKIQTSLAFVGATTPATVLVVTSSVPREGKSTTARNLALAMSETDSRVLLIDADLRRPSLSSSLGLESAVGLSTLLVGSAEFADVVQPYRSVNLEVLPCGEIPPNPHQIIGSPQMAKLVQSWRETYDHVVIDAPPLLPVSDAAVLGSIADGVVVAVGCKRVRRHQLDTALGSLQAAGARCLGLVVTMAPAHSDDGSYGHYGYSSARSTLWHRVRDRFGDRRGRDAAAGVAPTAEPQR